MSDNDLTDLLTPREAAKLLRCHVSQVYRWLLSGRVAGYKRGHRLFLRRQDVLDLFRPVEVREKPPPLVPARRERARVAKETEEALRRFGVW